MVAVMGPPVGNTGKRWVPFSLSTLVLVLAVFFIAFTYGPSPSSLGDPCENYQEQSTREFESEVTRGINWRFLCEARRAGTDKVTAHAYHIIYSRYLGHLRYQPLRILEIGLGCDMGYGPGKSLQMWRTLFPRAQISFLEYDVKCAEKFRAAIEKESRGRLYGGSQADEAVMAQVVKDAQAGGLYDLIVDDGGHNPSMQLTTLNGIWAALKGGGLYVVEDVQPTYFSDEFKEATGVYKHKGPTFMDLVPRLTELVHCHSIMKRKRFGEAGPPNKNNRWSEKMLDRCRNATILERQVLSVQCMGQACSLLKHPPEAT